MCDEREAQERFSCASLHCPDEDDPQNERSATARILVTCNLVLVTLFPATARIVGTCHLSLGTWHFCPPLAIFRAALFHVGDLFADAFEFVFQFDDGAGDRHIIRFAADRVYLATDFLQDEFRFPSNFAL